MRKRLQAIYSQKQGSMLVVGLGKLVSSGLQ
jgi:hypothetical protein